MVKMYCYYKEKKYVHQSCVVLFVKKDCSLERDNGQIIEEWTPNNTGKLLPKTINILLLRLFK